VLGALEQHTDALPAIPKLEPIPAEPQDLGLLLNELHALELRLRRTTSLGEHSGGLLSATQCVLRLLLQQGPKSVPQIARIRGTSRQNVQILVNRLRREGLVTFDINPAHRRSALVTLTEQGKSALISTATAEGDFVRVLAPQCSQSEVRSAVALLRRLRDRIAERETALGVSAAAGSKRNSSKAAREPRAKNRTLPSMGSGAESSFGVHELPVNLL
jgi:DNA-binding MarR family transcriptional regulator